MRILFLYSLKYMSRMTIANALRKPFREQEDKMPKERNLSGTLQVVLKEQKQLNYIDKLS